MSEILPGRYSPWFARLFADRVVAPMFKKKFEAVRLLKGDRARLEACADHEGPLLVAMNHAGWWDPLTALLLARKLLPDRTSCGPIDREVLESMGLLKKLGLFGVDPDDPAQADEFVAHSVELMGSGPDATYWITPQGKFTDPRSPVKLRPGLSAVSAECCRAYGSASVRGVVLSVEYSFWDDQRPGVFVGVQEVAAEEHPDRTSEWHRAWTRGMKGCSARLADAVIARDAGAFEALMQSGGGSHPVYDVFRKLLGKDEAPIRTRRESAGVESTKGAL